MAIAALTFTAHAGMVSMIPFEVIRPDMDLCLLSAPKVSAGDILVSIFLHNFFELNYNSYLTIFFECLWILVCYFLIWLILWLPLSLKWGTFLVDVHDNCTSNWFWKNKIGYLYKWFSRVYWPALITYLPSAGPADALLAQKGLNKLISSEKIETLLEMSKNRFKIS